MNVIARLEYELAYYNSAVHRFNHYTTGTPPASLRPFHVSLFFFLIFFYFGIVRVFVYLFALFHFHLVIRWNCKINFTTSSLFFNYYQVCSSGRVFVIRWYILKSQRILCDFSWTYSGLGTYHLLVVSFNLLHNSQWITFPPSHAESRSPLVLFCCIR